MTIAPEGRRLLRIEARNSQTPIERKPEWIKTRAKMGPEYTALRSLVVSEGLHTVCQEAACPNIFECWEDREATFLIGGDACTRRCDFCNIDTGKPLPLDRDEPRRVAESISKMGLRYALLELLVMTWKMKAPGCTPRQFVKFMKWCQGVESRCWPQISAVKLNT
jgi:lipoic acid synthetase